MAFDKIKKKSEAMGKKSMATLLKVNKYENPQMALDLIAHICTADTDIDLTPCIHRYEEVMAEMKESLQPYTLASNDFIIECDLADINMCNSVEENLSSTLKIAVAGGYSAGKSSLLNSITGIGDLLPTGVEPVSVVNTLLNCVPKNRKLIIRGKNLRDNLVLLNDEVLACIQHSSKSKVYIASVLKNIIIDTPAPEYLVGTTFIDTPGYNNSTAESEADRKTAVSALKNADAVLWCIDIEAGTLSTSDLEILKEVQDKPFVILYTKMDKKDTASMESIVAETQKKCAQEFDADHRPIAVMAVSCQEKKIYSPEHYDFKKVIELIKTKCGAADALTIHRVKIEQLFDSEIAASDELINNLEERRKELVKSQSENNQSHNEFKENISSMKDSLREMLIDSYSEIERSADRRGRLFVDAMQQLADALNRETRWSDKAGWFSGTSSLMEEHAEACKKFARLDNANIKYNYWEKSDRTDLVEVINGILDDYMESSSNSIDDEYGDYNEIIKQKQNETQLKKCLKEFKPKVLKALQDAYYDGKKMLEDHNRHLQTLDKSAETDIFSAISGDSYSRFLSCFSHGVDLTVCNAEDYSPLTWAVRSGNNEMVKFFIANEADLTMKDKRGYNALETAAMLHYQDICELLIEADNSLVAASAPLAELAQKNRFTEWVASI